jgi:hypothetical protein
MHMRWPGTLGEELIVSGQVRDLLTRPDGSSEELSDARLEALIDPAGFTIRAITSEPALPVLEELEGASSARGLRARLRTLIPDEAERGSGVHLMLDDLAGCSVIAPFVVRRNLSEEAWAERHGHLRPPIGSCLGYRDGATALVDPGEPRDRTASVLPLSDPSDPNGWHDVPSYVEPNTRRARRIDVWLDGDVHVDAWFQDSATSPDGTRAAVHEYALAAVIDPASGELKELGATPRALPFPECPLAMDNLTRVLGTPARELRRGATHALHGVMGCTHLTDSVRELADVPILAALVASGKMCNNLMA